MNKHQVTVLNAITVKRCLVHGIAPHTEKEELAMRRLRELPWEADPPFDVLLRSHERTGRNFADEGNRNGLQASLCRPQRLDATGTCPTPDITVLLEEAEVTKDCSRRTGPQRALQLPYGRRRAAADNPPLDGLEHLVFCELWFSAHAVSHGANYSGTYVYLF